MEKTKTTTRFNVYLNDKKIIDNEDIKTCLYWIILFNYDVKKLDFDEITKTPANLFLTQINKN
jgi:hypothetical protein